MSLPTPDDLEISLLANITSEEIAIWERDTMARIGIWLENNAKRWRKNPNEVLRYNYKVPYSFWQNDIDQKRKYKLWQIHRSTIASHLREAGWDVKIGDASYSTTLHIRPSKNLPT
jgi:hypothetical protein